MIGFQTVPAFGTVVDLDGQGYELVGLEPYTRTDGSKTQLMVWSAPCATCGDPFTVKSGMTFKAPNRRCDGCKRTGKPVKGRRGRKINVTVRMP